MTDDARDPNDEAEPAGDTKQGTTDGRASGADDAGDRVAQRIRRVLDHGLGGEG